MSDSAKLAHVPQEPLGAVETKSRFATTPAQAGAFRRNVQEALIATKDNVPFVHVYQGPSDAMGTRWKLATLHAQAMWKYKLALLPNTVPLVFAKVVFVRRAKLAAMVTLSKSATTTATRGTYRKLVHLEITVSVANVRLAHAVQVSDVATARTSRSVRKIARLGQTSLLAPLDKYAKADSARLVSVHREPLGAVKTDSPFRPVNLVVHNGLTLRPVRVVTFAWEELAVLRDGAHTMHRRRPKSVTTRSAIRIVANLGIVRSAVTVRKVKSAPTTSV